MNYNEFIIRIAISLFLSLLIGIERQWRRRSVGIRTNVLVSLGSFLFASIPVIMGGDSLRIAAQIVSGIGFLGAGVILQDGRNISGLNTAATLWCDAAVGVLCSMGLIKEAITGTLLILLINIVLRYITRKITDLNETVKDYRLSLITDKEIETKEKLFSTLEKNKIKVNNIQTKKIKDNNIKITVTLMLQSRQSKLDNLIKTLTLNKNISYINYKSIKSLEEN